MCWSIDSLAKELMLPWRHIISEPICESGQLIISMTRDSQFWKNPDVVCDFNVTSPSFIFVHRLHPADHSLDELATWLFYSSLPRDNCLVSFNLVLSDANINVPPTRPSSFFYVCFDSQKVIRPVHENTLLILLSGTKHGIKFLSFLSWRWIRKCYNK